MCVVEATGPRPADKRSRYGYVPDRQVEQIEIDTRFRLGLHFVGDWHTHPENNPQPSQIDIASMAEGVQKSKHSLNAFVLVIVGRYEFPGSLFVSLHDGNALHILRQRK